MSHAKTLNIPEKDVGAVYGQHVIDKHPDPFQASVDYLKENYREREG